MMTSLKSRILVAGAFSILAGSADAALVTGLVNHWKFDNNLNDAAHGVAGGSSSKADTGTFAGVNGIAGISYGAGLFGGNGISLDGAAAAKQNNGYVNVPRSADTLFGANATNPTKPNTVTTSMWVTVAGNDTDWQTLLSHGEGNQYRIARRAATVTNVGYAGGSAEGAEVGPNISGGAWHHIIGISEGTVSTRFWVDGALVTTGPVPVIDDARGASALNLHIGSNPDTGVTNREWWGQIDDVAQWNRVLTPAEIGQLWGGGPTTAKALGVLLIPEPASGLLGVIGLLAILRRRR